MNTQIRHAAKNWNVIMLTGIYGIPISQPKKKYKPNANVEMPKLYSRRTENDSHSLRKL